MFTFAKKPTYSPPSKTARSLATAKPYKDDPQVESTPRLQQTLGNQAVQRLSTTRQRGAAPSLASSIPFKTTGTSGGLAGLTLDVTFSVTSTPADSLQAIQTFMGTRRSDGVQVGTYSWRWHGKTWDAFVDGGKNSPYVTMGGNSPAHPSKPYYLTPGEVASQVVFSTDHGTIRIFDRPGAVALHDEAYFETAVVAVNYRGTGKDKILKAFKWGWTGKGTKSVIGKGTKIGGASSGILVRSNVSPEFRNIVRHDYPKYSYT